MSEARPPAWLAWARLVRAPNCLTAVADVLAGAALAGVGTVEPSLGRLALAALVSPLLYGAGCVLNDWADLPKDRLDKPQRPLPAGHVAPASALLATALLITAALGLATAAGPPTLGVAIVIVVAILAYDLGGKRAPIPGLLLLVVARSMNVALGAVALAGDWATGSAWLLAALCMGVYVAGLTGMSLFEERKPGRGTTLLVGLVAPAAVGAAVWWLALPWWAAIPGAFAIVSVGWALLRVVRTPEPARFSGYVRAAVLGVPLLDASFALGGGAWVSGSLIIALAVGARFLARRIAT